MSRIPYRALMRPQRTSPIARPGSPAALSVAPAAPEAVEETAVVEPPVEVEAEKPAEVVAASAVEPVAEEKVEAVEETVTPELAAPAPVEAVEEVEAVAPVASAPVAPKVNSASSKTDLLAAAVALGLTSVSATNTRAEIWAAIQAATTP